MREVDLCGLSVLYCSWFFVHRVPILLTEKGACKYLKRGGRGGSRGEWFESRVDSTGRVGCGGRCCGPTSTQGRRTRRTPLHCTGSTCASPRALRCRTYCPYRALAPLPVPSHVAGSLGTRPHRGRASGRRRATRLLVNSWKKTCTGSPPPTAPPGAPTAEAAPPLPGAPTAEAAPPLPAAPPPSLVSSMAKGWCLRNLWPWQVVRNLLGMDFSVYHLTSPSLKSTRSLPSSPCSATTPEYHVLSP